MNMFRNVNHLASSFVCRSSTGCFLGKRFVCGYDVIREVCHPLVFSQKHLLRFSSTQITVREYASKAARKESKSKKSGTKHVLQLTDEEAGKVINVESLKNQLERIMNKHKENFINNLSVRTSVGSLETLTVNFEDDKFPLHEVAQVIRKNPSLLIINVASLPTAIPSVLDALKLSGMNLNPQQEGTTIYVPLPQVTREHRENLARNAKVLFNHTKDELKGIQNKFIKNVKTRTDISEDLIFSVQNYVTALVDDHVMQAESLLQKKQAELLEETK